MKRGIKLLLFSVLVLAGVAFFQKNTTALAKSKLIPLKENRPYLQYDVTMDGKKDRIEVLSKTKKDTNTLRIRINDRLVYKHKQILGYADVSVIRMKKKQMLLYVAHIGEDDYGPRGIYSYKGGKWKLLLGYSSRPEEVPYDGSGARPDSVTASTVTVRYVNLSSMIGAIEYTLTYRYKDNALVRVDPLTDVYIMKLNSNAYKKNVHMTARRSIIAYDGYGDERMELFSIQPGDDVIFNRIYPIGDVRWFEVTVGGQTAWIPELEYSSEDGSSSYYFEDVLMYG